MNFLKLIRVKNLAFIILIQVIVRYAILYPLLAIFKTDLATGNIYFGLLVAATVFIAAGGYIINDYFDTRIDEINKPDEVIVGKVISRKLAMTLHQVLTGVGVAIGLLLSWRAHSYAIAVIFLFIPGLLWFYSSVYKRQFLIGNIIVSLCSALVPMTIVLFEVYFLRFKFGTEYIENGLIRLIFNWGVIFSLFAFFTTLIRELVKDMEDEEGDRELECNTVPIVLGQFWTKIIVLALTSLTAGYMIYKFSQYQVTIENKFVLFYFFLALIFPFLYFAITFYKAHKPGEFRLAGNIMKFIMFAGTMFTIPVYLLIAKEFAIPFFNLMIQ
ncbi:geranylgeranylglycerol-phosphate geranylgeranyltransferase [Saccharicrinis sp. FJH54]|uniref:geranylgeranylglycerol-phosphate geranylgeranyltransferase n=1 Tax=Saccharicrinis sp. FJH54 TaxID=3344665 RepID=UPI0035D43CB5